MAWYPYSYKTAFDPATMNLAPVGSLGQVYAIGDTGFSTPLTTYDLSGLPVDLAVQNEAGYIPSFQVEDHTSVIWKSGEYVLELVTSMPLPGPTGAKIVNATDNGDGTMSFTLSNGETIGPVPLPQGPKGERGPAGYNATGAVEDQQTLAAYIAATAGPNPVEEALNARREQHKTAFRARNVRLDALNEGKKLRAETLGSMSEMHPNVTVAPMVKKGDPSSITSPVVVNAYDRANGRVNPNLRILNGAAAQAGPDYPKYDMIARDETVQTYGPGAVSGTGLRVATLVSQSQIDMMLFHYGVGVQKIFVDGLLVAEIQSSDFQAIGSQVGWTGRLGLSFNDGVPHLVEWETGGGMVFAGYEIPSGTSLAYPASEPKGARHMILGDSFTEGTGTTTGFSFGRWVQKHLGWMDTWIMGSGSTGYVEDGSRVALIDRWQNDIVGNAPDSLVIAMGINDIGIWQQDPASVTTAAATIWDGVLAALPNLHLTIVGPWPTNGGVNSSIELVEMDAAFRDMAYSRGIRYISPVSEGWTFSLSDTVHPDDAGHETLGWRLAGHLAVPHLEAG